jgi:tetratricopeptide (TPR) repeat protein
MTRALVTSSKYSPGNMTPEALEALFVGREKTLSDVLKRISASATGEGKHFILLVGARGVGKTHFVALAYHRLMTDPRYAPARKRLKVAYLNEEEWGVASFVDLLVRILNALASGHGDKELEARIERIYEIHEKDPETARELAQSTLIEYVGEHTLLLLCENLADLFAGLEEEGQKRWRSLIQEHPFWTILATTPALFADVQLQTSPFYGFFTERHLERLDFETAVQLLQKKAEIDERRELAGILGTPTGRARVRAIHHLAGGNHRVYVTMSEFLDRESLDDLVKPFMRMVDDLTPYYQDRMRQLSPQQRKLIEFLSRHETPAIVKEVARRCLISPQTAAKQLGELAKLGFVQSIRSGRTTYYELAEPLMRICVEVKDNKTQHLKLFVRFLREWFTARELELRLHSVCDSDMTRHRVDRLHIEMALRERAVLGEEMEPLTRALVAEADRCWEREEYDGVAEACARLCDERSDEIDHVRYVFSLRKLRRFVEASRRAAIAAKAYPQSHRIAHENAHVLALAGHNHEALVEADRAICLQPKCASCHCLRGDILMNLGLFTDVILNEEHVVRSGSHHVHSLARKARALLELEYLTEAESIAREICKEKHARGFGWSILSEIQFLRHDYKAALVSVDRAIRSNPQNAGYLCWRGSVLEALRDYEAIVANEDRILAIDPTHLHSIYSKVNALVSLRRFDEAEQVILEHVMLNPRNPALFDLDCAARTGARGFRVGAEHFAASYSTLRNDDSYLRVPDFNPVRVLARMMVVETHERGLLALAEQVTATRVILGKPGIDAFLADALMGLLRPLITGGLVQGQSWGEAVRTLSDTLSDLPECEIPLKLLGAAARYGQTHDVADLLDLPLELRDLLLDAFAEQSGTSSTKVVAPAPASPRRAAPATGRATRTRNAS